MENSKENKRDRKKNSKNHMWNRKLIVGVAATGAPLNIIRGSKLKCEAALSLVGGQ